MTGPVFITFEGGEGSGKSTQANILRDSLVASGRQTLLVHEPGSTSLGDHLRLYLKGGRQRSAKAELLLFQAARAQLILEVVSPALEEGINVVADRYSDSTLAYQGYGRQMDLDVIRYLNSFATGGLTPNLTFLLDIDPLAAGHRTHTARGRGGRRPTIASLSFESIGEEPVGRQEEEGQRGFENQPLEFHRRVRRGYLELARNNPERWLVLDGSLSKEELANRVWQEVQTRLAPPGLP